MVKASKAVSGSTFSYMTVAILFLVLSIAAHMLFMKGKYDNILDVKEKFSDCSSGMCSM